MKTITVANKDYQLEFTFEAAEHRGLVQKMFNVLSGAYIVKHAKISNLNKNADNENTVESMIDGASEMVAEIPHICITAFYAGLLENNPLKEDEAKALMKSYMKENKLSYSALYDELKECMENDGFFDLSGLTDMMKRMNEKTTEQTEELPKQPQDHQKKSTSTK